MRKKYQRLLEAMIKLFNTYVPENISNICESVFISGEIASGSYVNKLEAKFQSMLGRPCISVNNSSNALHLILEALNLKISDKIAISPFTCLASSSAISNANLKPVWVDISQKTGEMCPEDLSKKIKEENIKAVIYYHFSCQTKNIKIINKICQKNNIKLIEDCSVSLGAKVNNNLVGTFGDFSFFSFYPNRQINAIDGGIIVSKEKSALETIIKLRKYGVDYSTFHKKNGEINEDSDIRKIGWNMQMNNLSAALAFNQISSFRKRLKKGQDNAALFYKNLKNNPHIELLEEINLKAAFWTFPLLVERKNDLLLHLQKNDINVSSVHIRNDLYSGFKAKKQLLKNLENWEERHLSIPCGWWLTSKQIMKICLNINNFYNAD